MQALDGAEQNLVRPVTKPYPAGQGLARAGVPRPFERLRQDRSDKRTLGCEDRRFALVHLVAIIWLVPNIPGEHPLVISKS